MDPLRSLEQVHEGLLDAAPDDELVHRVEPEEVAAGFADRQHRAVKVTKLLIAPFGVGPVHGHQRLRLDLLDIALVEDHRHEGIGPRGLLWALHLAWHAKAGGPRVAADADRADDRPIFHAVVTELLEGVDAFAQFALLTAAERIAGGERGRGDELLPDIPVQRLNVDRRPHPLEAVEPPPQVALVRLDRQRGDLGHPFGQSADDGNIVVGGRHLSQPFCSTRSSGEHRRNRSARRRTVAPGNP